jgi:hypothetical protein
VLWVLLTFHVILPFAFASAAPVISTSTSELDLIGLAIYQLLLVSIWAGLSALQLDQRLVIFILGTIVVAAAHTFAMEVMYGNPRVPMREIFFGFLNVSFAGTGLCSACLLVARTRLRLQWISPTVSIDQNYQSGISVGHLLLVTFLCAVSIAGTRIPIQGAGHSPHFLFVLAILLVPVVSASFALVWAVLTPRSSWLNLGLALAANVGAAALLIVQFDYPVGSMILTMVPGLIVLLATLFALRAVGYRLIRSDMVGSVSAERGTATSN